MTTPTPTSLHVPSAHPAYDEIRYLALHSALERCTNLHLTAAGFDLTPVRPVSWLSTGERKLWHLAESIERLGRVDEEAVDDAAFYLDPQNVAVVDHVLAMSRGEVPC